ncbi:hypothetical protein PF005_g26587 [Phytophthora fragariae]|uniref:Uncharacterized protein n=2 Tax=Phytophthora fragariae TaxID=53985 RepID=A0A6A3VSL1_9STRA|nr:hypothetical protein PF003_g13710 [Phytophthora fragariae]KAE9172706.1 hypothetical protein PF005_g26587 [Phytophthora fragariae]
MTDVVAETIVVIAESQWLKHRSMTCTMGLTLANRAAGSTRLDLQAVPAVAASTAIPSLIRIGTTSTPEQEVSGRVVRATQRNVAEMAVRPAVMIPPSVNAVVAEMIHVREGHLTDVVAEVTLASDRAMVRALLVVAPTIQHTSATAGASSASRSTMLAVVRCSSGSKSSPSSSVPPSTSPQSPPTSKTSMSRSI